MSADDLNLLALIETIRAEPNNKKAFNEWYNLSIKVASKFCTHLQRKVIVKKECEVVAADSVSKMWQAIFVNGYIIKKSYTTCLYYKVIHEIFYKTKKDLEISLLIDEYEDGIQ